MSEVTWDWPVIATTLIWKLAPKGFVLRKETLFTLPMDRVLMVDRKADRITLAFITIDDAQDRMAPELGEHRATKSELQGRYEKLAVCTAWQFARTHKLGKKDSITLTEYDRAAVPADLQLMASGHARGIEWQFLPNSQAKKIANWSKDNEGMLIVERVQ